VKTGDFLIQERMVLELQLLFISKYKVPLQFANTDFILFMEPVYVESVVEKCGLLTFLNSTESLGDVKLRSGYQNITELYNDIYHDKMQYYKNFVVSFVG